MKKAVEDLSFLPDQEDLSFLPDKENTVPEQTPTGLSKLTGQRILSGVPGGSAASTVLPGLPTVVGRVAEGTPEYLKKTGKALLSPENLVPTVAAIAGQSIGIPAPIAAGMAGAGLELAKGATPSEPAKTGREAIFRSALQGIPVVGQFANNFDVSPETAGKAALSGVGNVAVELTGGLLSKVPDAMFNVSKYVIPEVSEDAAKLGVNLDISQRTQGTSSMISFFKDVAGYGKPGQKILLRNQLENRETLRMYQEKLARDFAGSASKDLTREEIGAMLREDINTIGKTAQEAIERRFYTDLDAKVSNITSAIDTPRVPIESTEYVPYIHRTTPPGRNPKTGEIDIMQPPSPMVEKTTVRPVTSVEKPYPGTQAQLPVNTENIKGPVSVQGVPVPMEPLKEAVRNIGIGSKTETRAYHLVQNILDEGRFIPFREARELRSDLLRLSREGGETGKVADALQPALYSTMEDAAKKSGADVYQLWRKADTFSRVGHEIFDRDVVANLLINDTKHAESIGKGIYTNGKVTAIDQLQSAADRVEKLTTLPYYRKILEEQAKTNPRLYSVLEGKTIKASDIMDKAKVGWWNEAMDRFGYTDPSFPNKRFTDFTQLQADLESDTTKATMKRLFSPEQIAQFKKFVNVGAVSQKKVPAEMNGFFNLVGRTIDAPFSWAAAHAMTQPKAIKFATQTLENMSKGVKQTAAEITSSALRFAVLLATGNE